MEVLYNAAMPQLTLALGTLVAAMVVAVAMLLLRREKRPLGPMFTLPLLGDTVALSCSDPAHFLFARYKKYGSVFRLSLLGKPVYVVSDLQALRGPYRDEGGHPEVPFTTFKQLMGDFNVSGTKSVHGPWRKVSLAALGPQGLQALFPQVLSIMESHLREWEAKGEVQVFGAAQRMGLELATDVVADVELSEAVDRNWFKQQVATWLYGLWSLPLALPGSPLAKALAAKERLLAVLIREVKADHQQFKDKWDSLGGSMVAMSDELMAGPAPPRIGQMTRLGLFGVGGTELRDSAWSVLHGIMGAADTTRFALFNTWALVAQSPRVQERLFEEQKKVMAEFGPNMTFKAVASMPYLEVTVKECMRLLPATAGGLRLLTADLHVGDVTLPSGSMVWLYSHLLHCLDPVLWDGSTDCAVPPHMDWRNNFEAAFRPERWLSEDTKPKHYFTFGSGNHMCPGQNLAYLEVKTMLAMVLRKYQLRLQTPDMLPRCKQTFPFVVPAAGTDTVLLVPRDAKESHAAAA